MFEILLKISEGKPWKETLLEVLPERKFRIGGRRAKRKSKNASNQEDSEDENSSSDDGTAQEENANKN